MGEIDRLAAKHRANQRVRQVNSKGHLLALLFGQLSGADSLRVIKDGLASYSAAHKTFKPRPPTLTSRPCS